MASNNIESANIIIHRNKETLPPLSLKDDEYFGILTVKMEKTELVQIPTFLLFTIDRTGSMGERASGNCTKMDHVIQTFVSMMNYLSKLNTQIFIQVNIFNTDVSVLIKCVKITKDNVGDIITKIRALTCDGSTNIGLALQEAETTLINYNTENPDHQIGHIFMTDGEPTVGISEVVELYDIVNDNFINVFVGFGLQHNAVLLNKLSSKKNAEYQFVDNMENTALVYGETIHKFIYPALRNVELSIKDGLFYDWQTNTWTNSIYEPTIISEIEKIYHIKTKNPETVQVSIYGANCSDLNNEARYLETVYSIPDLIDSDTGFPMLNEDLTKYAFRQKVQELLFKAKQRTHQSSSESTFKTEMKNLFRTIRKYMRMNDLKEDGLLKLLCDDISQTYRTFRTNYGIIYASARCSSQGRQRTYNTNSNSNHNTDELDYGNNPVFGMTGVIDRSIYCAPPALRRANTNSYQNLNEIIGTSNNIEDNDLSVGSRSPSISLTIPSDDINDDTFNRYNEVGFVSFDDDDDTVEFVIEDEIENYVSENLNTTCFATPGVLNTMRSMSQV